MLKIKVGVRWWSTAMEQTGGVPLEAPPGHESHEYAVVDDAWYASDKVPVVNRAAVERRFPFYQDKHYR